MSDKEPTLSIAAASVLMGIKSSWCRELLLNRHRQNPYAGILRRPSGRPTGRLVVSAKALAMILRPEPGTTLESIEDRLGMVEAEVQTHGARIDMLAKSQIEQKTCRTVTETRKTESPVTPPQNT